ncbi:MAG: hypothetical protein LBV09_02670 [Deferribacteraceae bacterium]|jgi:TPR repeat protein|nr:hypothetical protein [Deferribacteraceae bacterium]
MERIAKLIVFILLIALPIFAQTDNDTLARAQSGDVEAMYTASKMYRDGDGVFKNQAKATDWLLKAANGGHLAAQYDLAVGMIDEAAIILKRSADAGNLDAMRKLGQLYIANNDPITGCAWIYLSRKVDSIAYCNETLDEAEMSETLMKGMELK